MIDESYTIGLRRTVKRVNGYPQSLLFREVILCIFLRNERSLRSKRNTKKEDEDRINWLASCEKRVPADLLDEWRVQADVASLLGTIYGELEQYELAIAHLDTAMFANKAEFPVKALEQRANYRVKHALRFRNSVDKAEKEPAIREIVTAIDELNFFNRNASTPEHLSLLGSAYKRLAWLQSGKVERRKSLEQMRDHYRSAFEKMLDKERIAAYPLTNWGGC